MPRYIENGAYIVLFIERYPTAAEPFISCGHYYMISCYRGIPDAF